MKRLPLLFRWLPTAVLAFAPQALGSGPDIQFEALAKAALERHGMSDRLPETFDFAEYAAQGFVHLEVGLFDLYMEQDSFADADDAKRLFLVASRLASMQADWLVWVDPEGKESQTHRSVAQEIAAELVKVPVAGVLQNVGKALSASSDGAVPPTVDLWGSLSIKADRLGAYREFVQFMQVSGGLGLKRTAKREPMFLFPSRARYIEAIALAGWSRPESRGTLWSSNVLTWTNVYVNEWRFLAMAFSPSNPTEETYQQGDDMENRIPTGLEQQIAQLSGLGLLDNYFGGRIPPGVAGGLSLNLVVEVFGECNTRVDGDLRERRKEAREMFVPGGQSEGGVLPPNLADSRWRDTHGKDHFLGVLKNAQKEGRDTVGRNKPKDKVRYFLLRADDEVTSAVLEAPVLGRHGSQLAKIPKEFSGDRLEFARSYASCFLYWLREKGGAKKEADSRAKFAGLLRALATDEGLQAGGIVESDPGETFEKVFQDHYGMPLSDPDLDPKVSLEGAFLNWLPKAR